jgi:hypothetical protein
MPADSTGLRFSLKKLDFRPDLVYKTGMKTIKTFVPFLALLLAIFLGLSPRFAFSQGLCEPCDGVCDSGYECRGDPTAGDGKLEGKCYVKCDSGVCFENPLAACDIDDVIDSITDFVFYVGVALSPLSVLFGAFQILTSGGDPEKLKRGRMIVAYTFVGLFILMFARAVPRLIRSVLSGP